MIHPQNAILRCAYQDYLAGNSVCYIIYKNISEDKLIAKSALETLESNGYIDLLGRPAIGAAYISLTDYGLDYCEETYVE